MNNQDQHDVILIAVYLAIALVFLVINSKASEVWLKIFSIVGLIGFVVAACWTALELGGVV